MGVGNTQLINPGVGGTHPDKDARFLEELFCSPKDAEWTQYTSWQLNGWHKTIAGSPNEAASGWRETRSPRPKRNPNKGGDHSATQVPYLI